MSKESTSGMKLQRAAGGGKQYGVPYGMGLWDAKRTHSQVAEAVIPALKDKGIEAFLQLSVLWK